MKAELQLWKTTNLIVCLDTSQVLKQCLNWNNSLCAGVRMKESLKKDFADNSIELNQNSLQAFILGARFINQLYQKNGFANEVVIQEAGECLIEVADFIDELILNRNTTKV